MTVGVEAFFAPLRGARIRWHPGGVFEGTRTLGGAGINHQLGERLWEGSFTLDIDEHAPQLAVEVRVARMQDPGQGFLMFDPRARWPRSDPGGTILGAAAPVIHALPAGHRSLRIAGLPPGYVLGVGTALSWQYASGPVRHAHHRLETAGVADGAGVTPALQVVPAIRPGSAVGAAVRRVDPVCKARVTGVARGEGAGAITEGAVVSWEQTLP